MTTRLVDEQYFEPLKATVDAFLKEIKALSLEGSLAPEAPRPLLFDNRQVEYEKSREKTTKIEPESVFCVKEENQENNSERRSAAHAPRIVQLVDRERFEWQERVKRKVEPNSVQNNDGKEAA